MQKLPSITIGQHSEIGIKKRNDDSYGVIEPTGSMLLNKGIAMAIADGMSTAEGAKEASETCVRSFLTDYYDTPDSWTVQTAISRVLSATNRWLNAQGQTRFGTDTDMACTFSGLILKAGVAHIFHVGDSQIARLRGDDLTLLTRSHHAKGADGKEYLARAMGVDLHIDIDYQTAPCEAGDIFIFTTDGVHEYLNNEDIITTIEETDDLTTATKELVQKAINNNSPDNLTCQLVRIDEIGSRDKDAYYKSLLELPFPPDLEPGLILDGYRIVRELHASPRSQVYLAIEETSGDKVVLKTPSKNFQDDPLYLEYFSREEWVGQTIRSPHVTRTLEPRWPRQFLYTLVEYVEGQTLAQWMEDNPKPSLTDVRRIIDQVIMGVRAFHRKEIIHQDLKPENIMINPEGTVKVVDFGSVRILGIEEAIPESSADFPMGTAGYTAPEIILGQKATSVSDLYSIAAITYEMLTGSLPYGKPLMNQKNIERAHYVRASALNPEVPIWLDVALERAVSIDPMSRQRVLSELSVDLTKANRKYVRENQPLVARNPIAFWQGISAVLFMLLLIALYL